MDLAAHLELDLGRGAGADGAYDSGVFGCSGFIRAKRLFIP